MNNNKNMNKKHEENTKILNNYQAWVQSGNPAINRVTNELLHQDTSKPFLRCYEENDLIRKQLPIYWFIREDKTLISFKYGKNILKTPMVVNLNTEKDRPCYAISIAEEKTTKSITDYDLMTLVWYPERIYGNARKLLEESLCDNLGKRDKLRNKVHGHHTAGLDCDSIVIEDTLAHDFCHSAPDTDRPMALEQEFAFGRELGKIAEQEPNKLTVFRKWENSDCQQGELTAHDKTIVMTLEEVNKKYCWVDRDGNKGIVDIGTIFSFFNIHVTVVDTL